VSGRWQAILVEYDPARDENRLYAGHTKFLRSIGMPVPDLLLDDPARHVSLFEDLGDCSLQARALKSAARSVQPDYVQVLKVMNRWHLDGRQEAVRRKLGLMKPLDAGLMKWERELFRDEFLIKRLGMTARQFAPLMKDLATISADLCRLPPVLIHRDLQSSNIYWRAGRPVFIDYQGMRFGPAVYDLASLLCDPYVSLSENIQALLVQEAADGYPRSHRIADCFWMGAVQRLVQALGAFGRLSARKETRSFSAHIPGGLLQLQRAVNRVPQAHSLKKWLDAMPRDV
jgi:aminoglycoside/choline kinase family phosphotransferase